MEVTRRMFLAAAGAAALGLAGCSSSDEERGSASQSEAVKKTVEENSPQDLVITESGWSVNSSGYTFYGFGLQNPNTEVEAQYPTVKITGRDASGSILFSEDQTLFVVFPQETVYYGFQAGSGTAPATVEFTLGDCQWVDSEGLPEQLFTIANTSEVDEGYGSMAYTGEITCNADIDASAGQYMQTAVTAILRDANGAIVYGMSTFIDTPAKDQPTPFEVSAYDVPEHASYEIYAQLW